jgi:hypothetical protein
LIVTRGVARTTFSRQNQKVRKKAIEPRRTKQQRGLSEDALEVNLELLDLRLDARVARSGLELGLQRRRLVLEFLDPRGDEVGEEDAGARGAEGPGGDELGALLDRLGHRRGE